MRKGFTLVELLIAISIIAILSVIGLTVYSSVQKNARDAKRKDDLRSIKLALELYYERKSAYPITDTVYSNGGEAWIPSLSPTYMAQVPKDPLSNGGQPWIDGGYGYAYWALSCGSYSAGQFFALFTQLENKSDNQRHEVQNYKWCDGTRPDWSKYSYVITSL